MTELDTYREQPAALSPIQQTANEMQTANRIATAIANSTFVPTHFRGKPDECTVAMLYGATIGLDPMTSVQQIYVISGKPALYARAMVAIVLAAGHKIWVEDESDGSVTVAGKRKGSDNVQRVTWTTAMAERAGYTSNKKYTTDPQSMLYARASGDLARRLAPDALLGMAYNVEEMQLVPAERQAQQRPSGPASAKDRVRAAIAGPQQPDPEPQTDEVEAEVVEPTAVTEPGITAQQSKKLHALVNGMGLDRDAKIAGCSQIIGRTIESTKDLTKVEAAKIIDDLEARETGAQDASANSQWDEQ